MIFVEYHEKKSIFSLFYKQRKSWEGNMIFVKYHKKKSFFLHFSINREKVGRGI